jgi:hypothetical protein
MTPDEEAKLNELGMVSPLALLPAIPTRPVSGANITTAWGQAVHDATFGENSTVDVRDGWTQTDMAANVPDGTLMGRAGMTGAGTYSHPLAGLAGAIIGGYWRVNALPSAGSIRLQVRAGGSTAPDVIVIDNASATTGSFRLATPLDIFSAGTGLNVLYGTTSNLAPTTLDINVGLVVAYDYSANP